MVFCVALPIFLIIAVKIIFLLAITPLILYRAFLAFKNVKIMKWNVKLSRTIENIIWIVYHFAFMFYCLIDIIPELSTVKLADPIKICGFIVIICIFGGGILDLLFSLINILIQICRCVRKIYKFYNKINRVVDEKKSNQKKISSHSQKTEKTKSKKMVKIQLSSAVLEKGLSKKTL